MFEITNIVTGDPNVFFCLSVQKRLFWMESAKLSNFSLINVDYKVKN